MEFEGKLIEMVKGNECLWSKRHRNYKNMLIKERIWAEIAKVVGKEVEDVKARWKSLRDKYVREENIFSKASTSGSAPAEMPTWPYFNDMNFLKCHIQRRSTTSNFELEPSILSGSGSQMEGTSVLFSESPVGEPQSQKEYEEEEYETPRKRRKQQNAVDLRVMDFMDKVESICTTESSRHDSFSKYLCELLEKLPLTVARSLEIEFLNRCHSVIDMQESENVEEVEYEDTE